VSGLNDPILPGPGATDYERYLRTDELLALQKTPAQMALVNTLCWLSACAAI